jgi:hypothetical protein
VKPPRPVDDVIGLGLIWNPVREQCGGRDTARLAVFWAQGPSPVTGVVTARLNGGMPFTGSGVISIHRFAGVDPVMPIGNASWANSNGIDGAPSCTGGSDTASYAWSTLDTVAASSTVVVAAHTARYTHTPGNGYSELADVQSADSSGAAGLAVQQRLVPDASADVLVTGGFSSSPDWAVIAVELRD